MNGHDDRDGSGRRPFSVRMVPFPLLWGVASLCVPSFRCIIAAVFSEVHGELLWLIGRRALAPGCEFGISSDPSCLTIIGRRNQLNSYLDILLRVLYANTVRANQTALRDH